MTAVARRMWLRFEPYHDVTYFTPDSRAATDALGCRGGWMGYFGMRAAPLGAASAEQVTSAFYNFHPARIHRALPDAWAIATPEAFLATRLAIVDRALRRLLGPDVLGGAAVAEAAELATAAAGNAPTAGRPLAAANARLPWPEQPHLALWQATTILRESRGDGHVAALITAELDPCETLVCFAADTGLDAAYMRQARGWSSAEWDSAAQRLQERGLLDVTGALTNEGRTLRQWVEERTDLAATAPWRALGDTRTSRLADLLEPLALAVGENNEAMRVNPMALSVASIHTS
ncbi:MAG: SCO6745 family protein [Actinocrinis sp.]